MKKILSVVLFLTFCPGFCFSQPVVRNVKFTTHWLPQAQFAGYFVAFEKGIYRKYGIDLQIISGGPQASSSEMIEKGMTDFASLWLTNAIELRDKGIKVVNIAQLVNKSALMLIAKKSSGIRKPEDMKGKKVSVWGGDFLIQPMAFFKKYKIDVRIIEQGSSINLFLMDGVDVTSAMWYNEYNTVLNSGVDRDDLITFFFSDYGLNFPEEGIYCLETTLGKNPELCRDFIKASLEGWKLAFEKPQEALDIVFEYMNRSNTPLSRVHQKWMLERMKDLIFPQGVKESFNKLSAQDFEFVSLQLKDNKLIKRVPEFNLFCRPQ